MYKSFTEMPVWGKAMELSVDIFKLTTSLPRSEDYGLTSQIRRSANSVSANIAEGFGRHHNKEKIQFYFIASGSITETQSHLIYGNKIGYFNSNTVEQLFDECSKIRHDLNKIIKSITK